jgi:DDE superfamily endonuclease
MGIGGPGVTKDRQGVKESGLFAKVQRLPGRFICVCDCAYQATEKFVPTFGGDLALRRENDNFNFFLSQLRIRIEMAFGLMTKKWGILQRPLTNSLSSIKHIICCIARLHNYCIDERLGTTTTTTTNYSTSTTTTTTINYSDALPTSQLAEMSEAAQAEHRQILSEEYAAWSHARDEIVQAVKQLGLKRPILNRKRKRTMLGSVPEDRFYQDAVPAQLTGPASPSDSALQEPQQSLAPTL